MTYYLSSYINWTNTHLVFYLELNKTTSVCSIKNDYFIFQCDKLRDGSPSEPIFSNSTVKRNIITVF